MSNFSIQIEKEPFNVAKNQIAIVNEEIKKIIDNPKTGVEN